MHQNCPVCFEFLFESIKPINVMPCGHTIHQVCDVRTFVPACLPACLLFMWMHYTPGAAQAPRLLACLPACLG